MKHVLTGIDEFDLVYNFSVVDSCYLACVVL